MVVDVTALCGDLKLIKKSPSLYLKSFVFLVGVSLEFQKMLEETRPCSFSKRCYVKDTVLFIYMHILGI